MKGMAIGDVPDVVVAFVVIGVVLVAGAIIMADFQGTTTAGTVEYNATADVLDSLDTISQRLPTLALVVVFAIILGVIGVFVARRQSGGI